MGAFVSDKNVYRVELTPEACPCLDQKEWIEVKRGMTNRMFNEIINVERANEQTMIWLKESVTNWSFTEEPVSAEAIDALNMEVIGRMSEEIVKNLPLSRNQSLEEIADVQPTK